jgi:dTDP-4-amino-4,6-dideoxygalactose transaminase
MIQNQLVPVFVDVNLGDYTAVPERIAEAIGPRTRRLLDNSAEYEKMTRAVNPHGDAAGSSPLARRVVKLG